MAQAYPASRFIGSDYDDGSIELARKRAADAGVGERVDLRGGQRPDLQRTRLRPGDVLRLPARHGGPLSAARHVREALGPGRLLDDRRAVAEDDVPDNINPVGRVYYNFSTLCAAQCKSQPAATPLAPRRGRRAIRRVVTDAGFTRFRRVAETPFNLSTRPGRRTVRLRPRAPASLVPGDAPEESRVMRACRPLRVGDRRAGRRPRRLRGVRRGCADGRASPRSTRSSNRWPGRRRSPYLARYARVVTIDPPRQRAVRRPRPRGVWRRRSPRPTCLP